MIIDKEVGYDQKYYKNIWENIINKYGMYSPIRDLGDISRADRLGFILSRFIKPYNDRELTVSDFGPGNWLYLPVILNWLNTKSSIAKINLSGFDFSKQAMRFSLDKFKDILSPSINIDLNEGNIETLVTTIKDKSHDLIISLETLEHIKNDRFVVSQFSRILRKGGHAIISIPNWNLPVFSRDWFAYRDKEILIEKDVHVGHYRRYTSITVANLFSDKGLKVLKTYKYGFLFSEYLKHALSFSERHLPLLIPFLFPFFRSTLRLENFVGNLLRFDRSEGIFVVLEKL